ncbi:hypothetical protein SAMN05216463_11435 [Xylanibacter ruminicola]|uniref:Uncharacterized protein n=1 Tax=Xylanibacter ruminicola TaxID=839 RepID=A0A1M6VVD0_XYLRU|nr:hypothetical protein SAMN05216463_11435 [Xylanibacter ruminicola]
MADNQEHPYYQKLTSPNNKVPRHKADYNSIAEVTEAEVLVPQRC